MGDIKIKYDHGGPGKNRTLKAGKVGTFQGKRESQGN